MLTRCPHCTTTFRVKPEQLKARLGRVRCGQCQTVFNALDSLVEEVPAVPATAATPQEPVLDSMLESAMEPTRPPQEPAFAEASYETPPEPMPEAFHAETAAATEPDVPEALPEAEPVHEEPEASGPLVEVPASPPAVTEAAIEPPPAQESPSVPLEPTPAVPSTPEAPEPAHDEEAKLSVITAEPAELLDATPQPTAQPLTEAAPEPAAEIPSLSVTDLDFVLSEPLPAPVEAKPELAAPLETPTSAPEEASASAAEPEPVPQLPRPPRRWPWAVLATLATLLLAGQALFYWRVEVAVSAPALKPLLKAACEPLGCDVPRPRKADLLDIESSDLHPGKAKGRLELVAVLKNKAPYAQELPVLELSLTDTADRPLIIKALQPADYLPPGRKPTAGFPAKGEINVSLTLDAGDVPATGYRLYLYYP